MFLTTSVSASCVNRAGVHFQCKDVPSICRVRTW
uniref:Uncharacterized protein n=1 Tax=Anguilla anguilla TaxID=7936 RepID=A0A0E9QGZ3_ANGAN